MEIRDLLPFLDRQAPGRGDRAPIAPATRAERDRRRAMARRPPSARAAVTAPA